jgi:hypothetical protein
MRARCSASLLVAPGDSCGPVIHSELEGDLVADALEPAGEVVRVQRARSDASQRHHERQ